MLGTLLKEIAPSIGASVHMEPEWGSVETIIYEAMENDMDAELEFWKAFAAARTRTLGY